MTSTGPTEMPHPASVPAVLCNWRSTLAVVQFEPRATIAVSGRCKLWSPGPSELVLKVWLSIFEYSLADQSSAHNGAAAMTAAIT